MTIEFAQFELAAWQQDGVLLVPVEVPSIERKGLSRAGVLFLSAAGVAGVNNLTVCATTAATPLVSELGQQAYVADGPRRATSLTVDEAPPGYWQALGAVMEKCPRLPESEDDIDYHNDYDVAPIS